MTLSKLLSSTPEGRAALAAAKREGDAAELARNGEDTMAHLVQVGYHRGFALLMDPQDRADLPTITARSVLTKEVLGTAEGQVAAGEMVERYLDSLPSTR